MYYSNGMSNITSHNLKIYQIAFNAWRAHLRQNFNTNTSNYCTNRGDTPPKVLFRFLIRQCDKLPEGPKQHYKFMIKQSFKQHVNETDPGRIRQIVARSYDDAEWVLKKYLEKK